MSRNSTASTVESGSPSPALVAAPDATGRTVLTALWVAWAAVLFGGMLATEHAPTWTRMASSLLLVVAGWVGFAVNRHQRSGRYAVLIAIGMTFGFFGDLFNARNIIIGGIIMFGIGHVAYIAACVDAARVARLTSPAARSRSLAVWMLIGILGWYVVAYRGGTHADLVWPALPYTLLLAGTAGMANSLAVQDRRFFLLFIGAAAFFFSDLILAYRLFYGDIYRGGDLVWSLYGPGQMLIVYSIGRARQAMKAVAPQTIAAGSR